MGSQQLDLDNLVAGLPDDSDLPYSAPSGFRIGHIHMRVGDTRLAEDFYVKATGLDLTALIPNESAAFFSNGRYHHHVGANIWHSRNAGQRPQNMSGLEDAAFSIEPALMDGLRRRLRALWKNRASGAECGLEIRRCRSGWVSGLNWLRCLPWPTCTLAA